jgi:hypothetical protein
MISKKICMLGAFAVGKTSMVARFVLSTFSEKYHTTVGVKVDKKVLKVDDQVVTLMLWDLAGENEFQKVQATYFRGAAGYLLVVDGTRRSSLHTAMTLRQRVEETSGPLPFVVVLNKADLADAWEVNDADILDLETQGCTVIRASAKTGEGVEDAFLSIARKVLG